MFVIPTAVVVAVVGIVDAAVVVRHCCCSFDRVVVVVVAAADPTPYTCIGEEAQPRGRHGRSLHGRGRLRGTKEETPQTVDQVRREAVPPDGEEGSIGASLLQYCRV